MGCGGGGVAVASVRIKFLVLRWETGVYTLHTGVWWNGYVTPRWLGFRPLLSAAMEPEGHRSIEFSLSCG